MYLAAFSVFFITFYTQVNAEKALRSRRQYPMTHWPPSNATRTRSLSNTYATDGDPAVNDDIYVLLTRTITQGFTTWKIKQFNDRIWLDRYRRSFWFGSRYYRLDNRYWLETRDTCAYSLDDYEKSQLHYEEPNPGHANTQIHEIFFQCQRYVDYCCGLRCCRNEDLFRRPQKQRHMEYPWSWQSAKSQFGTITLLLPFLLYAIIR